MQLPDEIHLLVKCNEPVDLSGIVFVMKVSAGTKNSYTIIFPKTNERGAAILSAEDFRGQFEDHHHFALMDYNGSVEAASSTVEFDLLNLKRLRESEVLDWPLMPHAERMWKTPKKRSDYLLSATNPNFVFFPTVAKIETAKPVEVTIGKKRVSAKS